MLRIQFFNTGPGRVRGLSTQMLARERVMPVSNVRGVKSLRGDGRARFIIGVGMAILYIRVPFVNG